MQYLKSKIHFINAITTITRNTNLYLETTVQEINSKIVNTRWEHTIYTKENCVKWCCKRMLGYSCPVQKKWWSFNLSQTKYNSIIYIGQIILQKHFPEMELSQNIFWLPRGEKHTGQKYFLLKFFWYKYFFSQWLIHSTSF